MRQRPHAILSALANAGHAATFVQRGGPRRTDGGVAVVPNLAAAPRSGPILYTHFAPDRRGFDRFEDPVVVYDVLDDLSIYASGEPGLPVGRRVATHHEPLLREADVVIASSEVLVDRLAAIRADVVLVRNGVDLARFDAPAHRPPELPDGPVVGYVGALAPWVDFDLLEYLVERTDWHLLLVGPADAAVHQRVASLGARDDVTWTGLVPFDEVAGYLNSFDVGIVPFVVDRLTEAVDPLKMYEYLAAGRGVVATPLPACEDVDGVEVADGAGAFVAAIERCLASDPIATADRARASAAEASWDARIAPLLTRLDEAGLRRMPA